MKLFVWDFHGVLEKNNEKAVFEITNLALKKNGFLRKMTPEENIDLCGKKWFQYFEYLLPQETHDIHVKLQSACIEIQKNDPQMISKHIKTNDYAPEILEAISKKASSNFNF